MAKPRCKKHQRSLPYCDGCKAAVKAAEDKAAAEEKEASEALEAEVGFPNVGDVPTKPGDVTIPPEPQGPQSTPGPYADNPPDTALIEGEGADIPDPWADGKTPAEGDDIGDWQPPEADINEPVPETVELAGLDKDAIKEGVAAAKEGRVTPADEVFADIDETEQAMTEDGEWDNLFPGISEGQDDTPGDDVEIPQQTANEVKAIVAEISKALDEGKAVTVLFGDAEERLRGEGRKEVIRAVKEYFADGLDTVAFQLLEYLEKQCK